MARPNKNTDDKASKVLPPIRVTDSEKAMIRSRAAQAGMTMSEYIRQMALYGEVTIRQSQYDHGFVEQLRRIGVNLNQQTKALNSTGAVRPELPVRWGKLATLIDHILENMQ